MYDHTVCIARGCKKLALVRILYHSSWDWIAWRLRTTIVSTMRSQPQLMVLWLLSRQAPPGGVGVGRVAVSFALLRATAGAHSRPLVEGCREVCTVVLLRDDDSDLEMVTLIL